MKVFSLFACLTVLALVGCKGGESNLVGRWKGEVKLPEKDKNDPMAKMAEGFLSMISFDLELKADHKYTMTIVFIPVAGDWSLSGNTVTLTPSTIMGMAPDEYKKQQEKDKSSGTNSMAKAGDPAQVDEAMKPIKLEVQPDGKTMKAVMTAEEAAKAGGGDLLFTKQNS